jgi:hypothetical protein
MLADRAERQPQRRGKAPQGPVARAHPARNAPLAAGNRAVARLLARQTEVAPEPDGAVEPSGAIAQLEDALVLTPEQVAAELGKLSAIEKEGGVPLARATAGGVLQRVKGKPRGPSTGGAPGARPASAIKWTKFRNGWKSNRYHGGCVYRDGAGEYVIPITIQGVGTRHDKAALLASLRRVSQHMKTYGARATKVIVGAAKARSSHLAKVTEGTGETAATAFVAKNYPGFQLVHGFGAGRGIDQVWHKAGAHAEYLLVEAKGPAASLSGAEMSLAWVQKKAKELGADPHGQAIASAVGPPGGAVTAAGGAVPRVSGIVLRASWTTAGTLTAKKLAVPGGGTQAHYN